MCAVYSEPDAMESLPSCTVWPASLVSHFSGGVVVFSPDSLPSFSPLWETASAMVALLRHVNVPPALARRPRLPRGVHVLEGRAHCGAALVGCGEPLRHRLLGAVNATPVQGRGAVHVLVFDPSLDRVIVSEASLVSPDWPDISAACVLTLK